MSTRNVRKEIVILGAVCGLLGAAGSARAASFLLQEQSARGIGSAFAGQAAVAEDASTIFYNPAGMTELVAKPQAQLGVRVLAPDARIENRGSSLSVGPFSGLPLTGSDDQGFDPQFTGDVYVAQPLMNGALWFGLAVTTPFGLRNEYRPDFFGRYDSLKTDLATIDVAPSVAYRVADWLSVGAGVDIQRADATLANALPNPLAPGGPSPATDGRLTAEGGDWSAGFNIGLLVKPVKNLRLGFSYRSAITHTLSGQVTTEFAGAVTRQDVSGDLDLPDIANFGAAWDVTPRLTLLAQLNYYGWSRFKELRLHVAGGSDIAIAENYRDTFGGSIGARYKLTDRWSVRTGFQYDETPTRDDFRSTSVPDSNRYWTALGVSYEITSGIGVDLSYAHLFTRDASINHTTAFPALGTTAVTQGVTHDSADVVGVDLRLTF
ncbi:MAG TPA: outer membrane protein transport protein [Stellaceae bacterium]